MAVPASKHRRRGKNRLRDRNQDPGYRFSPELLAELRLLHQFLRDRYGERDPTDDEMGEALHTLTDRLPLSRRLLHDLEHNDPDGIKARLLLAIACP